MNILLSKLWSWWPGIMKVYFTIFINSSNECCINSTFHVYLWEIHVDQTVSQVLYIDLQRFLKKKEDIEHNTSRFCMFYMNYQIMTYI